LDKIPFSNWDSEGFVAGMYIHSFSKVNELSLVLSEIEEMEKVFFKAPVFFERVSIIFYENNIEKHKLYTEKAIDLIIEDNDSSRLMFARTCISQRLNDHAINLLLPFEKYSNEAKELLLELLLDSKDEKKLELADSIVKRDVQEGRANLAVYKTMAEISLRKDRPDLALKPLIESFDIQPKIETAYNIVAVKININDSNDIEKYIYYLLSHKNSKAEMMGAVGLDFIKRTSEAQRTAFKALYRLGKEFDENVYLQYIFLYMPAKKVREDVQVEYDMVQEDSVVELQSDTDTRYICLNADNDLIQNEGEIVFDCEHYNVDSLMGIKIVKLSLNTEVTIDETKYTIKNVINKNIFAFRYCFDRYTKLRPNSKYIWAIKIDEKEPLMNLIPILEEGRRSDRFFLEQYNFANNLGLPVSALCHKNYDRYIDAVLHLFNSSLQHFYAGEVNEVSFSTTPVILSFNAIVTLSILNKLDQLQKYKDKVYITKSTL